MHLSLNAATTSFVFAMTVFVVCPVLFLMGHCLKKQDEREDLTLFLSGMNGKIEYLTSWYIFWDDIVPEIYQICRNRYDKPIGVYDDEFEEIGYELYGCEPAVEALTRAMAYMTSIGRTHHVSYSEDERWFHHYRRPDLTYRKFPITKVVYNQEFPEIQDPSEDDRRRLYCICSDGLTEIELKEAHKPHRRRCS